MARDHKTYPLAHGVEYSESEETVYIDLAHALAMGCDNDDKPAKGTLLLQLVALVRTRFAHLKVRQYTVRGI